MAARPLSDSESSPIMYRVTKHNGFSRIEQIVEEKSSQTDRKVEKTYQQCEQALKYLSIRQNGETQHQGLYVTSHVRF